MNQNRTVVGSGVGGALGFITVWALPIIFPDNQALADSLSPEVSSALTAALGAVFAALVRYLPKPKE